MLRGSLLIFSMISLRSGKYSLKKDNADGDRGYPLDQKDPDRGQGKIDSAIVGNFFNGISVFEFPGDNRLAIIGFMDALGLAQTPYPADKNAQQYATEGQQDIGCNKID